MRGVKYLSLVTAGVVAFSAVLVVGLVGVPLISWADPPPPLPASVAEPDGHWQPAFDYDGDGCYPTAAIGPDGTLNPGLGVKESDGPDDGCHDEADLDNSNSYARSKCDNGWCAYMYALYFELDWAAPAAGHRHDLEHVVVWVNEEKAKFVSVSQHGNYEKKAAADIAWDGSHAKVVYHKEGNSGTHAFRFASMDEQAENPRGWHRPALVSWNNFPPGIRDKLTGADFGSATLALKDGVFEENLARAKPDEVPFNPNA